MFYQSNKNLEEENSILKRKVTSLKRLNEALKFQNTFFKISSLVLFILLGVVGVTSSVKLNVANSTISELKQSTEEITIENENLSNQFNEVSELLAKTSEIAVSLDKDNESLKEDNLSMQDELNDFRQRAELYDKYDYAIIREEDGSRTDITYDNIKSLEELSAEQGLTEDANQLILSIAMTESRGYETAENSQSTATGFGQFLSGTGKFVYTSLMDGDGIYKHSEMAKDGQTNLDMMVYYISYLDEKYHGNLSSIIDEYRGTHDSTYLAKLDKYLGKKDLSTSTIQLSKR